MVQARQRSAPGGWTSRSVARATAESESTPTRSASLPQSAEYEGRSSKSADGSQSYKSVVLLALTDGAALSSGAHTASGCDRLPEAVRSSAEHVGAPAALTPYSYAHASERPAARWVRWSGASYAKSRVAEYTRSPVWHEAVASRRSRRGVPRAGHGHGCGRAPGAISTCGQNRVAVDERWRDDGEGPCA